MQASLEQLKQKLSKHFNSIVTSLIAVLLLLLYLTSLLSQATSLSNTLVDILIYLIYFALILTLGSLAYMVYNYYDEESLLRPIVSQQNVLEEESAYASQSGVEEDVIALDIASLIDDYKVKSDYSNKEVLEGFKRFMALSHEAMALYLQQQQQQLIVTILAYLPTEQAVEVLALLNVSTQEDVMFALQESSTVKRTSLLMLDKALYKDLSAVKDECRVLKALSRLDIQMILRQVSKTELMFALKGASQELQEMFFANMSPKASSEFQSRLSTTREISRAKSDNAIKNLYLLAQRLREDGKIRAT